MTRASRHILVVEDDRHIAEVLELNLRDEGYAVDIAADGETALAKVAARSYDLLVLDLMLPGLDGLEICRRLRVQPDHIPIIIISAKSAEAHRILGLELGADDYVTKPFSVMELVSRARALFRRIDALSRSGSVAEGSVVIQHGPLYLDPLAREVRLSGAPVALTAREFELLYFFARHPGQVFTRMELLNQVWGYSHDGYEHTVNSHINRLRAKIETDPSRPEHVLTVWGVGYKFAPQPFDRG